MTYLTEPEVFTRLREELAKFPSFAAFARERDVHRSTLCEVMAGKWNDGSGGFAPSVLTAIGVRKHVVYELVEDRREKAA